MSTRRRRRGPRGGRGRARARRERIVGGRGLAGGAGSGEDRPVAGAAAEIALQRVLDLARRSPAACASRARRATSRSPACRSRTASRAARPSPAGPDAASPPRADRCSTVTTWQPIERGEEADAGVDRLVAQRLPASAADEHGAGAAVALGAAFLGAAEPAVQPQVVEQRVGSSGPPGDVPPDRSAESGPRFACRSTSCLRSSHQTALAAAPQQRIAAVRSRNAPAHRISHPERGRIGRIGRIETISLPSRALFRRRNLATVVVSAACEKPRRS